MNNQHIRRKQTFLKARVANIKKFGLNRNSQRPTRHITKPKRYASNQNEAPQPLKKKNSETSINLDKDMDDIRNASIAIIPSQEIDRSYTQLMPGSSVTRVPEQLESIRSSTVTEMLQDENVPPNNSGTLNPLLHLQSLQQMPQTSESTEGYSEAVMENYRYKQHPRLDGYSFPSRNNYEDIRTTQHEHPSKREHVIHWHSVNVIMGELNNMRKQLENIPTKEDFEKLQDAIASLPTKQDFISLNQKLDRILKRQNNKMPIKPDCIPLNSVEEVQNFNNIDEEQYDEVVIYLKFLGGQTLEESVKFCMKQIIMDEALSKYSLWGEKDRNLELYNTQLLYAVYEAVANSPYFMVPNQQQFYDAVKEAIRFAKQRIRNAIRRKPGEKGRRGGAKKRMPYLA